MKLNTRLKRLERKAAQRAASPACLRRPQTDEDWLERFESAGAQASLSREPDFPAALAFYRDALRHAKAQVDPPFDPPVDFMQGADEHQRLMNWRSKDKFPKVREGWNWLAGMALRAMRGEPPVTEAEFKELAAWLKSNRCRLESLSPDGLCMVDLNFGRTSAFNLELNLAGASRTVRAGELADAVRKLKARYG